MQHLYAISILTWLYNVDILQIKNKGTGEIFTDRFDCVMACTGHSTEPYIPQFPGLNQFQGKHYSAYTCNSV